MSNFQVFQNPPKLCKSTCPNFSLTTCHQWQTLLKCQGPVEYRSSVFMNERVSLQHDRGEWGGGWGLGGLIRIVPSLTLVLRSGGLALPVRSLSPSQNLPGSHLGWWGLMSANPFYRNRCEQTTLRHGNTVLQPSCVKRTIL